MTVTHDFEASKAAGVAGEQRVAALLRERGCIVTATAQADQWLGIDFYVTPPAGLPPYTLEVKTDRAAHRTGNVFVEILSNEETGRGGWARDCTADRLAYLVDESDIVYFFELPQLTKLAAGWERQARRGDRGFRVQRVSNRGPDGRPYTTVGVLVPQALFEKHAAEKESL